MGLPSAVAIIIAFILIGITWIGWISASMTFLGWVLFIAAIIILLDLLFANRAVLTTRRRTVVE